MAEFSMKIAGHTAKVACLFESTPQYFKAYLTEDTPKFTVTVTRDALAFEQADLLEEAHRDGFKPRVFTDPFLERQVIQRAFAEYLPDFDTLLVHGSALALDGMGFLFTAHSGTGKSTHTRLWQQVFGDRVVIVNDDKPFVELTADGAILHGSPWSGKHGLDRNLSVPLKGICILERAPENRIVPLAPEAGLAMLQKQSYLSLDPRRTADFLRLIQALSQRVPLWRLSCNKDPQAAVLAREALCKL